MSYQAAVLILGQDAPFEGDELNCYQNKTVVELNKVQLMHAEIRQILIKAPRDASGLV